MDTKNQKMDQVVKLTQEVLKKLQIENYDKGKIREQRLKVKEEDFPELKNDIYLKAMKDRVPIWIMRQAGRYLSEFREVRKAFSFFEICDSPILACEVTLQPMKKYNFDASIIFSDILVIPKALRMKVEMVESKGPVLPEPLEKEEDLERLQEDDECLQYVYDAIYLTRMALDGQAPLICFCGSPWTLLTYMVEGGGSKLYSKAKKWIYANPLASHRLLNILTQTIIKFLTNCVKSGAQAIQIFDSHCHVLEKSAFLSFSLQYNQQIAQALKNLYPNIPITYFQKDQSNSAQEIFQIKSFDTISIDSTVDVDNCVELAKKYNKTIQGNMDPGMLYCTDEAIKEEVKRLIEKFGCQNYIFNLGQGIWPDMDPKKVEVLVKEVQNYCSK